MNPGDQDGQDGQDGTTGVRRFGRYRVTRTLGTGAMGEVYEAVDEVLGRDVAIKTLRASSGITARFIDDRFRNEARAIAQLSHPGVVQVFDLDLAAEPPYLVMERVAGPSLDRVLGGGPFPVDQLAPLGIQIARALAAAHAAGVVHRDVKPANILGAGPGAWKLADFGVAHVPDSSLTMTGEFVGSPAYAAPESLVKGVSGAASDVYALGATLYQAAAGRWPRAEAQGALLAPTPPLAQLAPHVPTHVAAAIDRAVALEHEQRPSAIELAELLAAVGPAPRASAPRTVRWQRWAIGGAILLVIAIAIRDRDASPPDRSPPLGPSLTPAPTLPSHITARTPPGLHGKEAKEWSKLVDLLYARRYREALDRLGAWEERFGATDETRFLRAQLERLPPEVLEGD